MTAKNVFWMVPRRKTDLFLWLLEQLMKENNWCVHMKGRVIRLRRWDIDYEFCPLGAVFLFLTGKRVQNCFWFPEIEKGLSFPGSEIVDIAYAVDGSGGNRPYDKKLRDKVLRALGLKPESRQEYFFN